MPETVYDAFREAAAECPGRPFLCYPASSTRPYLPDGAEWTYGEALAIVDSLADRYAAAGYGPGHRVALLAGNRPEHFWHLLALNRQGVSVVPLNPGYLDHELAFAVEFADCALCVAAAPHQETLERVTASMAWPLVVIGLADAPPPPARPPSEALGEAPYEPGAREALIIYTSGTTGRPKGCIISNTSCLAAAQSYSSAEGLIAFRRGEDRLYIPLPSFHMNVSVYTLNTLVRMRSCMILQDRFSVSSWWTDLVSTRATCIHYLGIIPPLLLKQPPCPEERQHMVRFGQGAGVDPLVRQAFERRFGFPLIEAWGMTETSRSIQNSGNDPRSIEGRSFGRPRAPLEVMVAGEDGQSVPPSTPGELLVRAIGPDPRHGFFSGYLKQPEETERAWAGGWFHTGDIVTQEPDGMLAFVERRKNIIRRSGENIGAAEVENALINLDAVHKVAVIGVADEMHDEEIMACIVRMPGVPATLESALAIGRAAEQHLARHKLPGWIAFVDDIPVTGTQKLRKGAIFAEGQDPRTAPCSFDLRVIKRRPTPDPASGRAS